MIEVHPVRNKEYFERNTPGVKPDVGPEAWLEPIVRIRAGRRLGRLVELKDRLDEAKHGWLAQPDFLLVGMPHKPRNFLVRPDELPPDTGSGIRHPRLRHAAQSCHKPSACSHTRQCGTQETLPSVVGVRVRIRPHVLAQKRMAPEDALHVEPVSEEVNGQPWDVQLLDSARHRDAQTPQS